MALGYLALLVAEIPLWLAYMIKEGEIDFATFPHPEEQTSKVLMEYFEANMAAAREALGSVTDEALEADFTLKSNGEAIYTVQKKVDLPVALNHWVHHRGQLTVYMRLNDIDVPAIYGPSADDKNFSAPK